MPNLASKTKSETENIESNNKETEYNYQINELNKKIEELTSIIAGMKIQNSNSDESSSSTNNKDDDVLIVSLFDGILNLEGVVPISFNEFGDKRIVSRDNINQYISTNMEFFKKGYFYVNCPAVIKRYGFSEFYDKLLTDSIVNNILNYNMPDLTILVENAPKSQQLILCDRLVDRCYKGEILDFNKLNEIDRCCGNKGDNTIQARAELRKKNFSDK